MSREDWQREQDSLALFALPGSESEAEEAALEAEAVEPRPVRSVLVNGVLVHSSQRRPLRMQDRQ